MKIKFRSIAAVLLLIIVALAPRARAQDTPQDKTFVVSENAFPWYDRINSWALTDVPKSLEGNGPLPQTSCASRTLDVPGQPAAVTVGVADTDADKFKQKYPAATATGESIAVKNTQGARVSYSIFEFPRPPATIGSKGDFSAGLLLLKISDAVPGETGAGNKTVEPDKSTVPGARAPTTRATATGNSAIFAAVGAANNPLAVTALPAKANFDLYLLIGQSNMSGRDASTINQQITNPRVLALNGENQWVVAKEPLHERGGGIGPGIPFALEMLRGDDATTIGIIPCAIGGTALSRWVKGGDLYEKAIVRARAAMENGTLKGVLWHQGESDTKKKENADSYQARLTQMFADLRADLGQPNVPIVVGQLGTFLTTEKFPYAETVRGAIKNVSETVPNVGFADSVDLKDKGDALHFSAAAQNTFGTRYAAAMKDLQKTAQ